LEKIPSNSKDAFSVFSKDEDGERHFLNTHTKSSGGMGKDSFQGPLQSLNKDMDGKQLVERTQGLPEK
jgi:hypothetical protein